MSVFADTSGLYPLLVRTDDDHAAVLQAFKSLLRKGETLATTSHVIVETAALLQHRIGLDAVRDFDARIVPLLAIEWVSPALHRRGLSRLLREDRRQLSLVDCVSLEHMEASGYTRALALDVHFEEAGHRLLPAGRRKPG